MKERIICIAVSLLTLLVPCVAFANAELDTSVDEVVVDEYSYTSTVSTTLTISNAGVAKPRAVITGIPGTTTKLSATMNLQRYSNGSWQTIQPGFPNNHTSIQESSNNYCYLWRASNGLTPRSRYSCSCFIRTSPCAGAFPGSR